MVEDDYPQGMSSENTTSKQPLIRFVNRQQMSWRVVDVERLIGEDHRRVAQPLSRSRFSVASSSAFEADLNFRVAVAHFLGVFRFSR